MLLSVSHQESVNSKNIVICNLFSSLVLLRRASVSQSLFSVLSVEGKSFTRDRNKAVHKGCVLNVNTAAHLGIPEAATKAIMLVLAKFKTPLPVLKLLLLQVPLGL